MSMYPQIMVLPYQSQLAEKTTTRLHPNNKLPKACLEGLMAG